LGGFGEPELLRKWDRGEPLVVPAQLGAGAQLAGAALLAQEGLGLRWTPGSSPG
jgi:hypothetical protein